MITLFEYVKHISVLQKAPQGSFLQPLAVYLEAIKQMQSIIDCVNMSTRVLRATSNTNRKRGAYREGQITTSFSEICYYAITTQLYSACSRYAFQQRRSCARAGREDETGMRSEAGRASLGVSGLLELWREGYPCRRWGNGVWATVPDLYTK